MLRKVLEWVLGGFGSLLLAASIVCFIAWQVCAIETTPLSPLTTFQEAAWRAKPPGVKSRARSRSPHRACPSGWVQCVAGLLYLPRDVVYQGYAAFGRACPSGRKPE